MATRLSSIESKLTIYVLIFSILFGVLFSAVQIGVDYRGESQRYLNNTAELLERQSSPAALSLYNYDKRAMQAAESKLEIEALHAFGMDFLVRFLVNKIVVRHSGPAAVPR